MFLLPDRMKNLHVKKYPVKVWSKFLNEIEFIINMDCLCLKLIIDFHLNPKKLNKLIELIKTAFFIFNDV